MQFRAICKKCKQPLDIEAGGKRRIEGKIYYCPFCNTPVVSEEFENVFDKKILFTQNYK